MTTPQHPPQQEPAQAGRNLLRLAIWVAIGALIAAAIVCVVWVLIGPENDIIGRAFLTILLLAAFAGAAILDVHLSARRPPWFQLTSMITWVVALLVGALLIWMPTEEYGFEGFTRFVSFLLVVLILQLALLHVRLYLKSLSRHVTAFTRTLAGITVGLVIVLTVMLILPLTFHEFIDFRDLYWRIVVAITILAAVGTALIPLMNALFAPKAPRPVAPPVQQSALPPWPTYADGATPLPMLPDGSPDWNAYYTGYPTYGQQPQAAPAQQQPALQQPSLQQPPVSPPPPAPPHPGFEGYPPPPPAPR